jgi:hypothetical protein
VRDQSEHNPALVDLEFLSGAWNMELSNAPFLPSRDDAAHGHVPFEWIEDGALLVMRAKASNQEPIRRHGGQSAGTNPARTTWSFTPTPEACRASTR